MVLVITNECVVSFVVFFLRIAFSLWRRTYLIMGILCKNVVWGKVYYGNCWGLRHGLVLRVQRRLIQRCECDEKTAGNGWAARAPHGQRRPPPASTAAAAAANTVDGRRRRRWGRGAPTTALALQRRERRRRRADADCRRAFQIGTEEPGPSHAQLRIDRFRLRRLRLRRQRRWGVVFMATILIFRRKIGRFFYLSI